MVHATGAAQLVSPREILSERVSHGLKARAHMPLNTDALWRFHRESPSFRMLLAKKLSNLFWSL
jgi:hypothetical protein